jgi:hypothetical protein
MNLPEDTHALFLMPDVQKVECNRNIIFAEGGYLARSHPADTSYSALTSLFCLKTDKYNLNKNSGYFVECK